MDSRPQALTDAQIELALANGDVFAFPARQAPDLKSASDEDRARVEVDGLGFNLHWLTLDVDLYVPALVAMAPASSREQAEQGSGPVP